jgi:type IV pilus assembly protein PilE
MKTIKTPLVAGRAERGFTLIELMIVLVIMAILAAIGYPSYLNSTMKSNRAAAQAHLMALAQAQQKRFIDARSYGALADLNVPEPDRVTATYTVAVTTVAGPPPTFTITATPISGSRQDGDGVLTIDNTGAKTRGSDPW